MRVMRQEYFASADALRAAAILLVVLNHLFTFARPTFGHRPLELGYLGVWGVNCFFLLSGCLLTGPFLRVLIDPKKPQPSVREFYTRRFLRIYPLYLVSVVFSIIIMGLCLQTPMTAPAVLSALVMLQNFSPSTVVAISPPLWTMGVDAAFYILLPPFAFLLGKFVVAGNYQRRLKMLFSSLGIVIAFCLIYRFLAYSTHLGALSDFSISAVYARNFAGMLTAFTLGAVLALFRIIVNPRKTMPPSVYLTIIFTGAAIAVLELFLRLGVESSAHYSLWGIIRATIVDPLAALSCALIFFGLSQGNPPSLQPILRSRYVVEFASWAYAVYLFHYPIMALVHRQLLHGERGLWPMIELGAISAIITLPVAILAHRFVEKPFLALKNKHRDIVMVAPAKTPSEAALR